MHSHSPRIIPEMAQDMPVLGSIRNKPTWRYTCLPWPLGWGMLLGTVVMVEATSSTPTTNKEWGTGHQKWMAEMQSWFDNITTLTWNTMECINQLDTQFPQQQHPNPWWSTPMEFLYWICKCEMWHPCTASPLQTPLPTRTIEAKNIKCCWTEEMYCSKQRIHRWVHW